MKDVSAGNGTCAVLASGGVDCWGGLDDVETPTPVPGVSGATVVSDSYDGDACAVLSSGGVDCWGPNSEGELGDGNSTDSDVAVAATGVSGAVAVVAGSVHTCAALASGGVMCWGRDGEGELGDGQTSDSAVPVTVTGLP